MKAECRWYVRTLKPGVGNDKGMGTDGGTEQGMRKEPLKVEIKGKIQGCFTDFTEEHGHVSWILM